MVSSKAVQFLKRKNKHLLQTIRFECYSLQYYQKEKQTFSIYATFLFKSKKRRFVQTVFYSLHPTHSAHQIKTKKDEKRASSFL